MVTHPEGGALVSFGLGPKLLQANSAVAASTKNVLLALSNLSAAVVFAVSGAVAWREALVIGSGAMIGGYLGTRALKILPEKLLKVAIVVIGVALTLGLFLRA